MSKLQVNDIVNKDDNGSPTLSKGAVVTGVATATTFDGALEGNVTGNINSTSASGISTVGILTAYSSVSIGSTNVLTAIDGKTSPGKAIALSMVFG